MVASSENTISIYGKCAQKIKSMLLRYLSPIRAKHFRVNMSTITPAWYQTQKLTQKQLEQHALPTSMGAMPLGELFQVSSGHLDCLSITESNAQLDYVGAQMRDGKMIVEGSTGDFTAAHLNGGHLQIHGDVGNHCAHAMRHGRLDVYGNAGNFAGAALAGAMHGQIGGTFVIHGDAGDCLGDRMRRGLLIVCRNAGDYPASRMIAGSIVVGGKIGNKPAFGMRRGSLFLPDHTIEQPSYFTPPLKQETMFLVLFLRHLHTLRTSLSFPVLDNGYRSMGDLSNGGIGEIIWLKT